MVLVSYKPIVLAGHLALIMHFLHAAQERETLLRTEEPMTTPEFSTALFYHLDTQLRPVPNHAKARLWPSEVVTLGLLHALKGGGNRAFYRWVTRDSRPLFPRLPERTRLFRLFVTHQDWTQAFLASPTVLGVIDTYGIELIHPIREGCSPQQIGRKGLSNHEVVKEPEGSPKFPSSPYGHMPRSSGRNTARTTVGREFPSCTLSVGAAGS